MSRQEENKEGRDKTKKKAEREREQLRNSEIKGDLGRRFFGLVSKKQNRGESERDRNRRTERFFFFFG